jgi:hypothetical protein
LLVYDQAGRRQGAQVVCFEPSANSTRNVGGADTIKRCHPMERMAVHMVIVAEQSAEPVGPPADAPNQP